MLNGEPIRVQYEQKFEKINLSLENFVLRNAVCTVFDEQIGGACV